MSQTPTSFQGNFDLVSSYVAEDMIHWINDIGESLVLYAMKCELERGKSNWEYVKAILDAWVKKGIPNVDAAKGEEVEYRIVGKRKWLVGRVIIGLEVRQLRIFCRIG